MPAPSRYARSVSTLRCSCPEPRLPSFTHRLRMSCWSSSTVWPVTASFTTSASRVGNARRLPGRHPPLPAALRVDGEIAHGELLLLAGVLHPHLGHAVDDPDVADHARLLLARRDPAIERLARAQVADVLGLRLLPRRRVHVGEIVGERRFQR